MIARINTVAFQGIDVLPIDVQAQVAAGLQAFTMMGPIAANRHLIRRANRLASLAFAFMLAGCAFGSIDDLRLGNVETVRRFEHPEYEIGGPKSHSDELFLKVNFWSSVDLTRIDDPFTVDEVSYFCGRPTVATRLGRSLFWNGKRIPFGSDRNTGQATAIPDPHPPFEYYTLVRVADVARIDSNPPLTAFNLKRNPEDVCIKLEVGNYKALGYQSNVVRVPAGAISAALTAIEPNDPLLLGLQP